MKQVIIKNWHYIIGALLVIMILVNTGSLLITIQKPKKTIEQPSKKTTNYIKPFFIDSVNAIDYFNNSIYIYANHSLVQMNFNKNFTNFQSIKTTNLIPYPNEPEFGDIGTITTNGQRIFVLDAINQKIIEVNQPYANNTYIGKPPLNIACNTSEIFTSVKPYCQVNDIKLLGTMLYILKTFDNNKQSELLGYNISSEKIQSDYALPNSFVYWNINQGETNQEILLGGYIPYKSDGFMSLNIKTGKITLKIQGLIYVARSNLTLNEKEGNRPLNFAPMFINNKAYYFVFNDNTYYLLYFIKFTLEEKTYGNAITFNLVTYGMVGAVTILIVLTKLYLRRKTNSS